MKKPAERDCLAAIPGYTGQVAKVYFTRSDDEKIAGVTVYDLQGQVKVTGDAQAAADWIGQWLEQDAGNRQARRTQLLAQMFICKLTADEKELFIAAQKPLVAMLAAAGVSSKAVAATSGAPQPTRGPASKRG